jgi:hypothetical protein
MVLYRICQAVLSVLALGGFFAIEYLRGHNVPALVPVICSWVAVVGPVLLATMWVVRKQYVRTLALAVLVAAVRVCLEDSLSDFMKTAGWFLIGAIVVALIVAVAIRLWRRGSAVEPSIVVEVDEPERRGAAPQPAVVEGPAISAVPMQSAQAAAVQPEPEGAGVGHCDACGAKSTEDGAAFCHRCGTPLVQQ